MRSVLTAALLALAPCAAAAQSVTHCNWQSDVRGIIEPWEDNIRAFADGKVRVIQMNFIEPAAGPINLVILTPPYDPETGDRNCWVVGWDEALGFVSIEFAALTSTYDPARGIVLAVPARFYDPELDFSNIGLLEVSINQSTGEVGARYEVTGLD